MEERLGQAETTLKALRAKPTWPMRPAVWLDHYKTEWGITLKKGEQAYERIARAARNDRLRRTQKEKQA